MLQNKGGKNSSRWSDTQDSDLNRKSLIILMIQKKLDTTIAEFWYQDKMKPGLLSDFMDIRFLLRICPRCVPSLVPYWIWALGIHFKRPNSGGEIIKLSSNWYKFDCQFKFCELIAKKGENETRSTFSPGSFWSSPSQGAFSVAGVSTQLFLPLWNWKFPQSKKIVRFHNRNGNAGGA